MAPDTQTVPPETSGAVIEKLSAVLADCYALMVKTHVFHWNVEGPHFFSLHEAFEQQYNDLFTAVDEIAERIRALGAFAPGGLETFRELSKISDLPGQPNGLDMARSLAEDHATVADRAREAFEAAESAGDDVTSDMMTGRRNVHEKTAWMLRSVAKS